GDERLRDLSFIEAIATLLLQDAKRPRQAWIAMNLPGYGLAAIDVPRRDRIGIELRAALAWIARHRAQSLRQLPVVRDALGNRKALLRVIDGRLQRFFERQRPEAPLHFVPAPHCPRHRYRENAALGHARPRSPIACIPHVAELLHARDSCAARRLAARI